MTSSSYRRSLFASTAAAVLLLACAGPARAQAGTSAAASYSFDIPAQPLSQAVTSLAAQAQAQIVIGAAGAAGVTSNPVRGSYSVLDALDRLLSGTGLIWRQTGAGVFTIEGSPAAGSDTGPILGAVRVEGSNAAGVTGGAYADLSAFGEGAGANGSTDVTATEGTRSLSGNGASIANKTPTAFRDTPQTVNVITREQFDQQNLTDVTGALTSAPGVTIVQRGASTPQFLSRGFAIGTFQVDGGAPLNYAGSPGQIDNPIVGVPDLSQYDHIEILRGSEALFAGAGDPGGVVSLQRKRPLDHRQAELTVQGGSWNYGRIEGDVTAPLAFDRHLRGRLVVAYQDNDLFYRFAHENRVSVYGVLEGDLGPNTELRGGGSYGRRTTDSPNAYGLPRFAAGGDAGLPRDANYSTPWAALRNKNNDQFVELDHRFSDRWTFNANVVRSQQSGFQFVPEFYGGLQPDRTGFTYSGNTLDDQRQTQVSADAHLNGAFHALGQDQKFVLGADYSKAVFHYSNVVDYDFNGVQVDPYDFDPTPFAVTPSLPTQSGTSSTYRSRQFGVYVNLMLMPFSGLHLNGGVRYSYIKYHQDYAYLDTGVPYVADSLAGSYKGNFTPSAGVVYDIGKIFSVYGSYNDIFRPQPGYREANGDLLPPQRGRTYEGGVKAAARGGKLTASAAYFDTKQRNVPVYSQSGAFAASRCCYLPGAEIRSRGVDVLVSGALTPAWQINAGYTYTRTGYNQVYLDYLAGFLSVEQTQQPRHQVKLWTAYDLPVGRNALTLSGGLRLESARYSSGKVCSLAVDPFGLCDGGTFISYAFTQKLYAVGDARVAYRLGKSLEAAVSLTNVTDRRYFETPGNSAGLNFYGEPRRILVSLKASAGTH